VIKGLKDLESQMRKPVQTLPAPGPAVPKERGPWFDLFKKQLFGDDRDDKL
jgi:hypothetical protein